MPIGKNSLKRVKNNGYSEIVCEAPDMENSSPVEEVTKKSPAKKTGCGAKKKSAPKKSAPAKSVASEPVTATEPDAEEKRAGFARTEIGSDMPYYLL